MRFLVALSTAAVLTLAAGCGSDDNGSDASAPASTSAATASTTAPAAAAADGASTTVEMSEFKFDPKAVEVPAGKVTISAPNVGKAVHELVLLRTDADPADLPMKGAVADQSTSVGEITDVEPGKTKDATLTLEAGSYVMICNLPGHYKSGMYGTLTAK